MFGYVRPVPGELKVKEYERFRWAYCGLCGTLKERYGLLARFILNYDFTFLAMLLSAGETTCQREHRRCIASPFRKRSRCVTTERFARCADYTVVLFWWKLRDSLRDSGFWGRLGARAALLLFSRVYKKAKAAVPDFDRQVEASLTELNALEDAACDSMDQMADKFACILAAAAEPEADRRPLHELLYHLGRIVYILDAADDLEKDTKDGLHNPVAARFGLMDGKLNDESRESLRLTLEHSCGLMSAAFSLLPRGIWTPVLENILYLGVPHVTVQVLNGTWQKQKRDRRPK